MGPESRKTMLAVSFGERLKEKDAEAAIVDWRESFQSREDTKIALIWDCRRMKGYETGARLKRTNALKRMKSQIDTIWLISDSSLIRMGASVMAMVTSLKIKPISSESEIVA
jgi:hypothetical protein